MKTTRSASIITGTQTSIQETAAHTRFKKWLGVMHTEGIILNNKQKLQLLQYCWFVSAVEMAAG